MKNRDRTLVPGIDEGEKMANSLSSTCEEQANLQQKTTPEDVSQ
jgi:hypothetical protein